ncbi:hypothetical protein [Runella slithyformis]|uniref:DUF2306 domain-containing protein n=1 Tax=Runella slithyformis (strain ATCC 29530 / DSM 19594 / LMG 11500 / NCIMB 11436 / LSU 4) TaxID=761193 RepID=A0A7U4E4G8_RUNSL|nr:hypothetical protein [Runella slithyformis]AEI47403.1 hypothetical protein Runsl_0972 [Runella slithyformis DSM 19594]
MKTFFLITHIAVGFLALAVGLVPMLSKKGSRLHNVTGLIYYWSMVVVAVSAVVLVFLSPVTDGRLFLTGIAVFSFYLCFTGRRSLKQRNNEPVRWYDWGISGLMAATAGAMVSYGLYHLSSLWLEGKFESIGVLFIVFGFFAGSNARYDFKRYRSPDTAKYGKREWFFMHIVRMCGSYIATFTAFALVNIRYVFPDSPAVVYIATWILPGVIGGMIISRVVRFYLVKFKISVQ